MRCRCGAETEHSVDVVQSGVVTSTHIICEPCFERAMEGYREAQRQFRFLVDNGVSSERANEIMVERIKRGVV